MNPIDYMGMMPQGNFLQNVLGGLQVGSQIQQLNYQQQQQQIKQDRLKAYNTDISTAMQSPTPQAFAALALKYPEHREAFKQGWETLDTARQQTEIKDGADIAATLHSGRADIAQQKIEDRIAAAKNSGQPTEPFEKLLNLVKTNPQQAYAHTLGVLAGVPGGDKILANLGTINTAPATEAKATADASAARSDAIIKGAQAAVAPVTTDLGNQKTAQEIAKSKVDADVAQFNAQIAAANSETQRGELTLQRDKYIQEQAKLQQTQGFSAQDGMDTLTQGLQTVKSIKDHPGLKDGFWDLPTYPGTVAGPIAALIPGTDRKDLESLVDTLKSQQFMAGIKQMTGMGSLSNAEGEKIGAAVASLNTNQSIKGFKNALGVIESNLTKAQQKTVARGQLPKQGEAFVMKHPVYGVVTEGKVNALMSQFPGSTRDQVLQFLQQSGGSK